MSGLAKRIQDLQKKIVADRDSLTAMAEDENADTSVMDALSTQLEADQIKLAALQRTEAQLGKGAVSGQTGTALIPSGQQQGGEQQQTQQRLTPFVPTLDLSPNGRSFAVPGQKIRPADYIFKAVTTSIRHFADPRRSVLEVLKETYGDGDHGNTVRRIMAEMITKAAAIPADTTTSGWASNLVQTVIGDFIESLIPYALYPKIAARGASYTFGRNGTISLPARNTGTAVAGAFIAQGAAIPVKQGAFTSVTMTP